MSKEVPPVRASTTVRIGTAVEHAVAFPIRAVVTMPLAWIARGLVLAAERLREQGSNHHPTAREVTIPLYEVLQWAVMLDEYLRKRGRPTDPSLEALRFVRNRSHHQAASPVHYDTTQQAYIWYPAANLPLPEDRFADEPGESAYAERMAGRPMLEAVEAAAAVAAAFEE